MIRIRTPQYSVEGCVSLCFYFLSVFFVKAATTKTVNVDEWFESLESFIKIIRVFFLIYEWVCLWIKHISNVLSLMSTFLVLIATSTCKSMLNWVLNQTSWISMLLIQSYSKCHEYLWVVKKRFIAVFWYIRT